MPKTYEPAALAAIAQEREHVREYERVLRTENKKLREKYEEERATKNTLARILKEKDAEISRLRRALLWEAGR